MKLSKRILALFLSISMLFSLNGYPVQAFADDDEEEPVAVEVVVESEEDETGEELPEGEEEPEPAPSEPSNPPEPDDSDVLAIGDGSYVEEDYSASIPYGDLTGDFPEDLIRIAQSQVGYRESTEDFLVDENEVHHGYTRYGAWYGEPYLSWDCIFVLFCLYYANYATDWLAFEADCGQWLDALRENGLFIETALAEPQPGDLVFTSDSEERVRAGIVYEVSPEEGETWIDLIQGDIEGAVTQQRYTLGGQEILGFVRITAPESEETPAETPPSKSEDDAEDSGPMRLSDLVSTLPVDALTGDWAKDLLVLASSQLGYEESGTDTVQEADGEVQGYTYYGEYCGYPYGDWCAMFVFFCLDFANVPTAKFPRSVGVNPWVDALKAKHLFREAANYSPTEGDLVFFVDQTERACHMGIVTEITSVDGVTSEICVIEGNVSGKVIEIRYKTDDARILGYGALSAAQRSWTLRAAVYTDGNRTETGKEETADVAIFGELPSGAYAEAFPVTVTLESGEWLFSAWDITLYDRDGQEITDLNGPFYVTVTTPEAGEALRSGEELAVYHIHGEKQELLSGEVTVTETSFSFETESFSTFVLGSVRSASSVIHISNYDQLQLIGTDAVVTDADTTGTVGSGNPIVLSGSGTEEDPYIYQTYANDATYYLDNDFTLPSSISSDLLNRLLSVSGIITSESAAGDDNKVLHDQDTRLFVGTGNSATIYIHNIYQMYEMTLSQERRTTEEVRNIDYDALTFGAGSRVSALSYYYQGCSYVLASNFTAATEFDVTESTTAAVDGEAVEAIVISTYEQLKLVGLGESVLKSETINGIPRVQTVNYPSDAVYYLANDIQLADDGWQLPADFTGSFTCDTTEPAYSNDANRTVNTSGIDDIYIQNVYQLEMLGLPDSDREEEPILSGDFKASTFGTGSLITSGLGNLSYGKSGAGHRKNFILSRTYSNERAAAQSSVLGQIRNEQLIDGRDWFGQTTVEIDGTTYILIGDRQQLDAIGTDAYVYGPVYRVTQTRASIWDAWQEVADSVVLIYPGDADLVGENTVGENIITSVDGSQSHDFSQDSLYGSGNYHALGTERVDSLTRYVYCASDGSGGYDTRATLSTANRGTQQYSINANYIVFRDIDMNYTDKDDLTWRPLMFTGTMYGVKTEHHTDVSTLWDAEKTVMNLDISRKPEISNLTVLPDTLEQLGQTRLDLNKQVGVGFFGTLSGDHSSSSIIRDPVIVNNIRLKNGTVSNPTTKGDVDASLVNGLLVFLGTALGTILDPALKLLTGKDIGVRELLTGLLNARAKDPSSLATGAFAGRIIGDAQVLNCDVEDITVTTLATEYESDGKIVGKGGFVGYVEGETKYDTLSLLLGSVGDALTKVLNVIPGVGLGDLITVLLDNALPLEDLIPTGYSVPVIRNCVVNDGSLSTEAGKYGVGGFAGSVCGTDIYDSRVINSSMTVNADHFGGGFVGIERDAIIKGTLSGLGIDIGSLHPQSELIRCSILDSSMRVTGDTYLGGFVGAMANSYGINDTVSGGRLSVSGTGDFVGGFCGYAHLGTLFSFGNYLEDGESLLSTVKGLVTGLLGSGSDQSLLDVGGVAPSAIMGVQIDSPLTVSSEGAFVGGIVGRGNGTFITSSSEKYLRELGKYDDQDREGNYKTALPISAGEARANNINQLVSIMAGAGKTDATHGDKSFAGGLAGYLTSANIGGLLGETAGIAQYLGFTVCDTTIQGVDSGYTVTAAEDYGAGGIGWAVGGDVYDVELLKLRSVEARNHAGGFVGATGPGDLISGNGLDLELLGISLIKIDNLLSLASGIRTTYERANVTGIDAGFTVEENGLREGGDTTEYMAGGWAAQANSVRVVDCHAENLLHVLANMQEGYAGGFVGSSSAGGLAGIVEDDANLSLAQVGQLVDAVPYLVPSYDGCSVRYVDGGFVQADMAGGFAGDFQSGKVNTYSPDDINPIRDDTDPDYHYSQGTDGNGNPTAYSVGIEEEPWSVYNIDHVRGGRFAGGWGGKVYSGALVSAGGGLSVLGGAASASLSASQLLSVASVYVPILQYAGVYRPTRGYTVYAAHDYENPASPATEGYAGGFIGYGSGVQVSFCDVFRLRHGQPTEPSALTGLDQEAYARFGISPAALESQNGSSYMVFDNSPEAIPYAVAGAVYAGGYIGHMDVGSAASVGDGLKLLGSNLSLTNVLDTLSVVVSTIEHSDVTGSPGGFNVVASPRINNPNGSYGNSGGLGVAHAGGFAGKISGGHIQDSNVNNFYYIIGEVSAGGYAGEAVPGDVASILKDESSVSLLKDLPELVNANSLASLVQDFIPTIRNSETNCVPCGGAVRAQCFSDDSNNKGSVIRGMAGGYIGHSRGTQIWGESSDVWKDEDPYQGEQRECAALRIRSVYGAEYAGGFVGLMEPGSTAQTGGLSLLGDLVKAQNLLGALQVVYPTIRYGAVYGPLEGIDEGTWEAWKQYVGSGGAFYPELARASYAELENFFYGTHVVAGRHEYDNWATTALSGTAGGFVGSLHSGVIRHSHAEDSKLVLSMRASGGFAGEIQTKGATEFGSVGLLGLDLNLGSILNVLNVFASEISESGTNGYRYGLTVSATGDRTKPGVGVAGGYCGGSYGGQLGLHHEDGSPSVWVHKLKRVCGTNAIGGFIGKSASASLVNADTSQASNGFLQQILNSLVSTPEQLASLAQATLSTIKYAEVTASDDDWGLVVEGGYQNGGSKEYAYYAGGFAGLLEGAVLGEHDEAGDTLQVTNLRAVNGGHYVGGFFGLADTGSVAEVGGADGGSGTTKLLSLLNADGISAVNAFRTYIYHASVNGVRDGITVTANDWRSSGVMSTYQVSGAAGGFGGGLINGTVKDSQVSNLNAVKAPHYAAGFIGIMDRNGVASVDDLSVSDEHALGKLLTFLGLDLSANVDALNIIGSIVENSSVSGISAGFTTVATTTQLPIGERVNQVDLTGSCAAGFTGFGDVSQIDNCQVSNLKYAVSPQIAAGFIGRGSVAYLIGADASSGLTEALVGLVNLLLRILYLGGLENIGLLDLPGEYLGLRILSEGDLLYVNLLGLRIGVSLSRNDAEYGGNQDAAIITIGSSTIKLPCNENGIDTSSPNVQVQLIEGNRTTVRNSSVRGIPYGYDVFGGGAGQNADGTQYWGYAGGFVGYNESGFFSHDRMWLCDVVRGTANQVGPFSGHLKYNNNTYPASWYEYNENKYSIYRSWNAALDHVETAGNVPFGNSSEDSAGGIDFNRYDVLHYNVITSHADLEDAMQKGSGDPAELEAWVSSAKAVLMLDTPLRPNEETETVEPDEMKDPCDELFDLTVHKKWRDYNNKFDSRPEKLEIEVQVIDVGVTPRMQLVQSIFPESDWSPADFDLLDAQFPGFQEKYGSSNPILMELEAGEEESIHWKGKLEGLPVAYRVTVKDGFGNPVPELDENGDTLLDENNEPVYQTEIHYLQYVVTERVPDRYKLVQYEILEDTASVIILNELDDIVLPSSGGSGISFSYMLAGIPLFIGMALFYINSKKRRKEVQNE